MHRISRLAATLVALQVAACYKTDFTDVSATGTVDLANLAASPASADADGAATITLSARVPAESQRAPTHVTFQADIGTFVGTGNQMIVAPIDAAGVATVNLRAPADPASGLVRAFAGQTTLVDSVRFIRTLPDTILVDLTQFAVLTTDVVTVTAIVRRRSGAPPTRGAEVTFAATRANGASIGSFGAATLSDVNGAATVRFCSCDAVYAGPITLRASVRNASGQVVAGIASILVSLPKE